MSRSLPRLLYSDRERVAGPSVVEPFLGHVRLQNMFETIGGRYDLQNHLLSMWRDRRWRAILVEAARAAPGALIYDMAIGTGDVAIPLVRRYPETRLVGIDNSPHMLRMARRKISAAGYGDRIRLLHADIRATGLEPGRADIVTSAFTLRNLPDRDVVLREFRRLLKPTGRLFILELALPQRGAARALYLPFFDHCMPLLGNLLSRTDYAYSYLRESVHAFPTAPRFLDELRSCGFARARAVSLSYGTAVLYICAPSGKGETDENELG